MAQPQRVLITGSRGMLGKAVVRAVIAAGHEPIEADAVVHQQQRYEVATTTVVIPCDVVINCAGVIGAKAHTARLMIAANAIGPWNIAQLYSGKHVVLVSTDCVFSGDAGTPRSVTSAPDPQDLYGRSKLCGEVRMDNTTIVRTSFVGLDHGLLRLALNLWLDNQVVSGWTNSYWSGGWVDDVAEALVSVALASNPRGLDHLANPAHVTKYDMLNKVRDTLGYAPELLVAGRAPRVIMRALTPTITLPSLSKWTPKVKEALDHTMAAESPRG